MNKTNNKSTKEVENMAKKTEVVQGGIAMDKFEVVMSLVNLIKGIIATNEICRVQQMLLDLADNTDELTQDLMKALHVVLFDDDYVKASKIVKDNIVSLLDGNGNLYYDPNLIVTVMLPSDLKEIMMDFLLEPDTDFSLLADKVIKECGAEIFRRSLFEGLSEWDPVYSFNYVEKYKQYLSDEEIAKLTIDRYRAIPILERGDIEYLDPRTKKMIKDVAKRTGREFSFT